MGLVNQTGGDGGVWSGDPGDEEALEAALMPYVPRLAMDWVAGGTRELVKVIEGSLAFVDISGFTRLTEILAGHGKAGAEELTGFLDRIFANLLEIAYGNGGELIKWGGDAVLVWFTGTGHPERAVEAAWRMQRVMRRMGRLKTSAGPARLRMSVGIHAGSFHFFLVGERHLELLVTGPGATATARMEALAEAGEIVVSPALADHLAPGMLGASKQDGFLIASAPRVSPSPESEIAKPAGATAGRCLAAELRTHLLASPVESEHRQVAVAFLEFKGVDGALASQGDEVVAGQLDEMLSTIQESCSSHGVTFWETDIAEDGGKVMLVAGAPRAGDDDAGRLLITVREILDRGGPLPLRAGVNHGRVFAGDFGPLYRRTYSAKGDAVNLAARLMARAGAGELYASAGVVRRSRVHFETRELEPFLVKGKLEPVRASLVGALRTAEVAKPVGPGLVGREVEMGLLRDRLAAAAVGQGGCVELVGPSGIGKSRLISELQEVAGAPVLAAVCDEYRAVLPYASVSVLGRQALGVDLEASSAAVGQALATTVARRAAHLLPWLPLLASALRAEVAPTPQAEALEERFRRERLEDAFLQLLSVLLPERCLMAIDDAQWMDDASASLVRRLVGALPFRPWLLVVGRRPDGRGLSLEDFDEVARLDLGPLAEADVAQLLRAVTAERPLAPHQRDAIAGRSGGNPLFLLQLVETGLHSGFETSLPDTVEEVLAAQIDRLAPQQRRILRVASVLGMQVTVPVLAEMLDDAADVVRLAELDDFLSPDRPGTLRFRHSMVRDAAYEGLPYSRRRELHARAGAVLERNAGTHVAEISSLLALHFGHATQHRLAWRYGRMAGERARAVYASLEAATFFARALEAARQLGDVPASELMMVAESLGDAQSRLGEFAPAADTYRTACRWAAGAVERARLRFKVALATDRAGNYPLTLRTLSLAERSLSSDQGTAAVRLRAEIRAQYGLVRHRQGRSRDAVRQLLDAVRLAGSAGAPEVLATALVYLDIAELTAGRSGGSEHASRALDIIRGLGDQPWLEARALNQLGIRAYFAGRWSEAVDYYAQSCEACRRAGDEWTAAVGAGNIAEVLADQGRLEQAEPILEEALRTYRAAGTPTFIGYGTMLLGKLAARRGDHERAQTLLETARGLWASDGEALQVLQSEAVLAESRLIAGDLGGASAMAQQVLAASTGIPGGELVVPLLRRVLGLAEALRGGDSSLAKEHLQTSVDVARRRGSSYDLALSLQAMADLWPELDPELRRESSELFEQLGVVEAGRRAGQPGLSHPLS